MILGSPNIEEFGDVIEQVIFVAHSSEKNHRGRSNLTKYFGFGFYLTFEGSFYEAKKNDKFITLTMIEQ